MVVAVAAFGMPDINRQGSQHVRSVVRSHDSRPDLDMSSRSIVCAMSNVLPGRPVAREEQEKSDGRTADARRTQTACSKGRRTG